MRVERPADRRFARLATVISAGAGAALGAMFAAGAGAVAGLLAGALVGLLLQRALGRRAARRRAALASPFPESWRELLLRRYDHYERLDAGRRGRFEDDLRIFLAEKRITGVGVEVDDELRLLVAASAVTLSLGWPDYEWDPLTEVLLYPDDFDRDYNLGQSDRAGEAHTSGTVILSVPSLLESFECPDDAFHVGLHEFAHLLGHELYGDYARLDAIPAGFGEDRAREWQSLCEREMERLRRGKSAFDDYGADDPVEFLGVAIEAFFEIPQVVRRRHREVYAILCAYFGQDPAAWDDARGLKE